MITAATLWGLLGILLGLLLNAITVWLPARMAAEEEYWLASARDQPYVQTSKISYWRVLRSFNTGDWFAWFIIFGTGTVALILNIRFGNSLKTIIWLIFFSLMIILAAIDLKTKYLPDLLTIPLIWIGLIIQLFPKSQTVGPAMAIAGAASGYCVLWLLAKTYQLIRRREGVGFGDLKLLAAIGAWLGPAPLPWIMFLASLMVVTFHALRFLLKHRGMMKQEFAFGPWIVAGTFLFYYAAFLR